MASGPETLRDMAECGSGGKLQVRARAAPVSAAHDGFLCGVWVFGHRPLLNGQAPIGRPFCDPAARTAVRQSLDCSRTRKIVVDRSMQFDNPVTLE
jgi:hypothetical protein